MSTSSKYSIKSSNGPFTLIESSGTGCSSRSSADNFKEILEDPHENPKNPQPVNVVKRKLMAPTQDSAWPKITALEIRLSSILLSRDVQLDLYFKNDLKKTRKKLAKQQ